MITAATKKHNHFPGYDLNYYIACTEPFIRFFLISGCPRPSIALHMQSRGLRHHSFMSRPSIALQMQNRGLKHHSCHFHLSEACRHKCLLYSVCSCGWKVLGHQS